MNAMLEMMFLCSSGVRAESSPAAQPDPTTHPPRSPTVHEATQQGRAQRRVNGGSSGVGAMQRVQTARPLCGGNADYASSTPKCVRWEAILHFPSVVGVSIKATFVLEIQSFDQLSVQIPYLGSMTNANMLLYQSATAHKQAFNNIMAH
jgi:hypothetical protein